MFTAKSPDKLTSDAKRRIAVSTDRAHPSQAKRENTIPNQASFPAMLTVHSLLFLTEADC